ncbi:MAG: hypothetical protein GY939_13015 [Actinomycetia bacterium]|nr:hypothetical protein [Actinomycetes bacterium]
MFTDAAERQALDGHDEGDRLHSGDGVALVAGVVERSGSRLAWVVRYSCP